MGCLDSKLPLGCLECVETRPGYQQRFPCFCNKKDIVQRIRVKIAVNVVKTSNIGTNQAHNIKIKIRLGGISKIFSFCSHANMAASDKGISLKKKFLKTFLT